MSAHATPPRHPRPQPTSPTSTTQRIEQSSCSSRIRRLEALGKAILDGLKNLAGTGSILLPDQ